MTIEFTCATGDGTALSAWPLPNGATLVCIDVGDSGVYLTEEQVIELIQYLECLITGDSHGD